MHSATATIPPFSMRVAPSPRCERRTTTLIAINVVVLLSQRGDGATRMENGGMVAVAECIANIRQAHLGEVLRERHCELTRPSDRSEERRVGKAGGSQGV